MGISFLVVVLVVCSSSALFMASVSQLVEPRHLGNTRLRSPAIIMPFMVAFLAATVISAVMDASVSSEAGPISSKRT